MQPVEHFEGAAEGAQAREHFQDRFLRAGRRQEHLERTPGQLRAVGKASVERCERCGRRGGAIHAERAFEFGEMRGERAAASRAPRAVSVATPALLRAS